MPPTMIARLALLGPARAAADRRVDEFHAVLGAIGRQLDGGLVTDGGVHGDDGARLGRAQNPVRPG